MISANHFSELSKHLEVFDLAINHNYIPSGQNGRVQAIERVHKEHFNAITDMSCGSCVFEMLKRMWIEYTFYKEHFKPLEETKVPIVVEPAKPKEHGKRKNRR